MLRFLRTSRNVADSDFLKGTIMDNNPSPSPQTDQNEKASFVVAIIGLCFAALGAAWSFVGGVCCG
jgi:hypothetical protein